MSLFKYFNVKQDSDGNQLFWGSLQYPFLGQPPANTTQEEYDDLKPTGKARCRTFSLAIKEDLEAYVEILDRIANQWYIKLDKDRRWDEESKNYKVYLEWFEPCYMAPPITDAISNKVKEDEQSETIVLPISRLSGLKSSVFDA